ncbi:DUF4360 domain-containing protein [Zooshikella sp. RANM57]|uniref:DUF4360 domain-containing protein n=1 Tax=Zooshikella sp. RANM57 TaxID=3425863 RepID=UPI003D6FECB6
MIKKSGLKVLGTSSLLVAVAFSTAIAQAQTDPVTPPHGQVYVKDITYGGSGCPQGSVGVSVADSGLNFGVSFDEYIAGIGPDFSRADKRKNCDLRVNLHVPSGYSYTIADVNYRGYADLDRGIIGKFKTNYRFQGERLEAGFVQSTRGPVSEDILVSDSLDLEAFVWSACGATAPVVLQTKLQLAKTRMAASDAGGVLGVDSIEGKLTHEYSLVWRRCSN